MEVTESALKHGVDEADIEHAWANAIRLVEYDYEDEERLLVIGPTSTAGNLEDQPRPHRPGPA